MKQTKQTGYGEQGERNQGPLLLWLLPVFAGFLFCLWYIKSASCDVVYSDYIRLIDAYLPDVTDPSKFLVPDVLTRIPASFLQRLINVKLFDYSVTFDRVCAASGLLLCGTVLALYARRERLSGKLYLFWLAVLCVLFSLIKWEALLNGTAWAHVVSFGLFFLHYYLLDSMFQLSLKECVEAGSRERCRKLSVLLTVLPFFILMFAGEYIAAYCGVLILAYAYCLFCACHAGKPASGAVRLYLLPFLSVLCVLMLYLLSRHFAVWEHAGATELSFSEAMAREPLFLPRFFVKTFAGAVLGQETIAALAERGFLNDNAVFAAGLLVIVAYVFALYLYFVKAELYRKTLFPLILLLSGGMNHVLVTASRWIFLKESYALSSRYAAQFMIGIIGILLIFALYRRETAGNPAGACRIGAGEAGVCRPCKICNGILIAFCIFFLAGNCYTTYDEIKKAPYREENYEAMAAMLRDHEAYSPEELCKRLEWGKSPAVLEHVIEILEENHLNVFRR
ncbi:MAG: hypothetical protein Q4C63_08700 [Eubacteriales bacterium]|nr:hypothetical protein [Eubacteriales bacterium]